MNMEAKYVNRRRALAIIVVVLIASLFTYATRDTCYVGNLEGNFLGYGSCDAMLDAVVGKQ
jgi:hypothetical protein